MMNLLWLAAVAVASEGEAAAHGGGHGGGHEAHGIPWEKLTQTSLSFLGFVVILVIVARRPIMDALRGRASGIQKDLDEAARAKESAEARFAEIEARLVKLDRQIEEMKTEARADADAEVSRIQERAMADAERIQTTVESTIREETNRARLALRKESILIAAELAKGQIKQQVTPDDQIRLANEFLARLDKERAV